MAGNTVETISDRGLVVEGYILPGYILALFSSSLESPRSFCDMRGSLVGEVWLTTLLTQAAGFLSHPGASLVCSPDGQVRLARNLWAHGKINNP